MNRGNVYRWAVVIALLPVFAVAAVDHAIVELRWKKNILKRRVRRILEL